MTEDVVSSQMNGVVTTVEVCFKFMRLFVETSAVVYFLPVISALQGFFPPIRNTSHDMSRSFPPKYRFLASVIHITFTWKHRFLFCSTAVCSLSSELGKWFTESQRVQSAC